MKPREDRVAGEFIPAGRQKKMAHVRRLVNVSLKETDCMRSARCDEHGKISRSGSRTTYFAQVVHTILRTGAGRVWILRAPMERATSVLQQSRIEKFQLTDGPPVPWCTTQPARSSRGRSTTTPIRPWRAGRAEGRDPDRGRPGRGAGRRDLLRRGLPGLRAQTEARHRPLIR